MHEYWTPAPDKEKLDQPIEHSLPWPWKIFLGVMFVIGSWLWVEVFIHVIL